MGKKIDPQKLYTVDELEDLLGIRKLSIQRMIREKRLKGKKMARRWYVTGQALLKYFQDED